MCLFEANDYHIELAIDVLKSQDKLLLQSLKDFLKVVPNPICVEKILVTAIYRLAKIDSEACGWILSHPDYLMPELDLINFSINFLAGKLKEMGFVKGEDFQIRSNAWLDISPEVKEEFLAEKSESDRWFILEIMKLIEPFDTNN